MGTDYAEKERIFVAGLEADTGRGLEAWLAAITESGHTSRNDIIDWLRQNGFTFSNASWIERIHHNGGRLVYAGDAERAAIVARSVSQHPAAAIKKDEPLPPAISVAPPSAGPARSDAPPAVSPALAPGEIRLSQAASDTLAAAKGLRPLAVLALQEVFTVRPDTSIAVEGPLLMLSDPRPYLALLPGAKALRLYGDFSGAGDGRVTRAEGGVKISGKTAPSFASVLELTDARRIDQIFIDLVRSAHARAHS